MVHVRADLDPWTLARIRHGVADLARTRAATLERIRRECADLDIRELRDDPPPGTVDGLQTPPVVDPATEENRTRPGTSRGSP